MATITTDTFLDGGVARTAGEVWTMNGGILTIRTDTRVHINAPAAMTGSIGATTTSATLGGGVLIDSRAVRWMPYNAGSGTVPAIGTLITQGGISGYLLGVWPNYTSAPTAPAAAMPVTGYLKFREVTGGAFAVGALTAIGASATAPDRQGWIEVVQRQAVANTVPRLGFFRTRGGWFELDQVTSGSANDVIQVPTNGGGAGTNVPALWIETGAGTNVYELFPAVLSTWYLAANLDTDQRNKFVQTLGSGQVRIGWDGAANAGFVPPAGCKIRIPSNIGRQSTLAGGDGVNQVPNAVLATRPDFTTSSAGDIDFEFFINDWYHLFSAAFKIKMVNCATFDAHTSSNEASPTELNNYACGAYIAGQTLTLTNNSLGGTLTDCRFVRPDAASNGHSTNITGCSNYVFTRVRTGVIQYARSTGSVLFSQCRNFTLDELTTYQTTVVTTTCSNFLFTNLNYIDRLRGVTNATTGKYAVQCTVSCDNIKVDGIILSFAGDLGPYLGVFNASNSSNLTFRNLGTRLAPVDINTSFAPAYIFQDSGNNDGVRVQRCYLEATRISNYVTINTSKNITFESTSGTTGSEQTLSLNTLAKGIRSTSNSITGGASVYGSHTFDMFESNTVGRIWWAMNEPTAFSSSFVTLTLAGSTGGFTSGGQVAMPTISDVLVIETPYYILGHTAFANSAATLTGVNTGNFTYEFAIDLNTGAGFSSYQTLNGANLSAETISPSVGFKMRLRITTTATSTTNAMTYVRINTVTTAVAQDNLYPLDLATVTLTGYVVGTRIQLYNVTDSVELYNDVPAGATLELLSSYTSDKTYRVRAMYQIGVTAYEFVEFTETFTEDGLTRSISQTLDAVYNANAVDGSLVTGVEIDDASLRVNVDTGVLTWQSLYAYETYWLQTAVGIRDEQRFIVAIDQANYTLAAFKIKNVSSPSVPLVISNGYGVDLTTGEAIDIINTTGGTIFNAPDRVVPFATGGGGGGATATEVWNFATRTLSTGGVTAIQAGLATANEYDAELAAIQADLDNPAQYRADVSELATEANATTNRTTVIAAATVVNGNVKKASLLVPATADIV